MTLYWAALLTAFLSVAQTFAADSIVSLQGQDACTSRETWTLPSGFPKAFKEEFEKGYQGKASPVSSFSNAIGLRRMSLVSQTRALSEYWISRSLWDAKLPHVAFNGFEMILSRRVHPDTFYPQLAALNCIVKINEATPSMSLPAATYARLFELNALSKIYGSREVDRKVIWRAALVHLMQQLTREDVRASDIELTLSLLKNGGVHEEFAQGMWAARRSAHTSAIKHLQSVLSLHDGKQVSALPSELARYVDTLYLLLGRSQYGAKQFSQAALTFKKVKHTSNDLAESLSELAWAHLLDGKLQDAIGTATSLQAGGLRHTFAPEAVMVQAMAMNELCQFPESIRAVQLFRTLYEKPYRWLSQNGEGSSFYKTAIAHLRKTSDVPTRVGNEWIRSPVFRASQQELNLLFEEKSAAATLSQRGAREQRNMATEILKQAQFLKYDIVMARKRGGPDEPLPAELRKRLLSFKQDILVYKRLMAAAPIYRSVIKTHHKRAPGLEKKLIARIDADIKQLNRRMMLQLEEIADNSQLIEVEIFGGATHDIIWQNAHPDYKELAQEISEEQEAEERAPASQVWNWGRTAASSNEETEIWEDELGAFKASLFDNCSSKNKYLSVKMRRRKS